jgi:hypothetical protein
MVRFLDAQVLCAAMAFRSSEQLRKVLQSLLIATLLPEHCLSNNSQKLLRAFLLVHVRQWQLLFITPKIQGMVTQEDS